MTYRTETEAWNEDTKTLKEVEETIKKEGVTEENYFDLFSKVLSVKDRSSFGASKGNKYYDRVKYCKKLKDNICNAKRCKP